MPKILTASHATQVPDGGLAEWYHLLPFGVFEGRDGRGPYVMNAPDERAIIAAFAKMKCDLPVDYEHQSLDAKEKSGAVPAAGWIKEIARRMGGLWARVEWTETAARCLANKEYRYLSPVFVHDKAGHVKAITMAALTNTPNLHLQAAASREEVSLGDDFKKSICALLGLDPATATDDEILEGVSALKGDGEAANSDGEGDEPKEDEDKDKEAAQKRGVPRMLATHSSPYDPTKLVPMELFQAVSSQLAKLQAEQGQEKASGIVASAIKAGKLPPAQRDWAVSYASRDLAGFKAFIDGAPVIVPASHDGAVSRPGQAIGAITPEQKAVAVAMGIDPALYLKELQKESE